MTVTAAEIKDLLRMRFDDGHQYLTATEVPDERAYRHLDFMCVKCWESEGQSIDGFEIKVSKADLRRELENPWKHAVFFTHIDTFSLVAPREIVDLKILPPKWGFLAVVEDTRDGKTVKGLKWIRRPLALHDEMRDKIDRRFAVRLMRHLARQSTTVTNLRKKLESEFERGIEEGIVRSKGYGDFVCLRKKEAESAKRALKFIESAGLGYASDETLARCASIFNGLDMIAYRERTILKCLEEIQHEAGFLADKFAAYVRLREKGGTGEAPEAEAPVKPSAETKETEDKGGIPWHT